MPTATVPVTLWPYQEHARDAALAALARGEHPVISLPTGSGKSLVIADLCARLEGRILVATHRQELLEQNAAQLQRYDDGAESGIYSAGLKRRDDQARVIYGRLTPPLAWPRRPASEDDPRRRTKGMAYV